MKRALLLGVLLLSACGGGDAAARREKVAERRTATALERAAVERGLIRDPADTSLAGLYARDDDRLCVVPDGFGYRIGVSVDYGDAIGCSGSGRVTRVDETLHIELGPGDRCSFDASYDGDRIRFPGALPAGCSALCSGRASLAGLEVALLSESGTEAGNLRDARGRRLCDQSS